MVGDGATVLIDSVYKDIFAANGCDLHLKMKEVLQYQHGDRVDLF
ncbi:MAG: hypothetical protein WDM90_06830 [Ferruginibacter sp.]